MNRELAQQGRDILVEEVEIFEEAQEPDIYHDTQPEEEMSLMRPGLDKNPREVVYDNGEKQDEYIHRLKHHVEIATDGQQEEPTGAVGEQEIYYCSKYKIYREVYGVK
jgi:RNA:NAD 2'-phosphotransferase (TPT1/KptA family)